MNETLTETERLTFGALLGALIRMDGYTTPAGQEDVVRRVAKDLLPSDPNTDIADAVGALLERSAERYRDAEAVRASANAVTRQDARDAIFGALYEVSAAGTINSGESQLLDWLKARWDIRVETAETPTG